jgi:hypothetical protein
LSLQSPAAIADIFGMRHHFSKEERKIQKRKEKKNFKKKKRKKRGRRNGVTNFRPLRANRLYIR